MTPDRVGSLIGGVFGLIYVVVNAGLLPAPPAVVLRALAAATFVGLLILIFRSPASPERPATSARSGFGRDYWLMVAAEVAAGVAGSAMLRQVLGAPQAVVAWISLVVGAHFFGLALVWREPFFRWLGGALVVCGVAGLVAAAAGLPESTIAAIAGVVPGALLLASGYWGVARRRGTLLASRPHVH